jgi:hypothetical protein
MTSKAACPLRKAGRLVRLICGLTGAYARCLSECSNPVLDGGGKLRRPGDFDAEVEGKTFTTIVSRWRHIGNTHAAMCEAHAVDWSVVLLERSGLDSWSAADSSERHFISAQSYSSSSLGVASDRSRTLVKQTQDLILPVYLCGRDFRSSPSMTTGGAKLPVSLPAKGSTT